MSSHSKDNEHKFSKDNTNGFFFNGKTINEKNGMVRFMSIVCLAEYLHASTEELRLADYEKKDINDINKYNIINNSSNCLMNRPSFFSDSLQGGLFGNNTIFNNIKENNDNENNAFNENNENNVFNENNENNEDNEDNEDNENNEGDKNNNLFGKVNNEDNNDVFTNIQFNSLFNTSNTKSIFIDSDREFFDVPNKTVRNNISISCEMTKKCHHEKDYICYCLEDPKNEGGLLCYDCLYKYHKNHNNKCIPLISNNFENYKKHYKEYISEQKMILKKKFDEIISKLDDYENEVIDNISKLFEEKVNLNFELPIELTFIERFDIAINKKIASLVKDLSFANLINPNCLNLFKNRLKDLRFSEKNPNYFETLKLKSSVNFNLMGIGLPKIGDIENKSIEAKLYKGNVLLGKITKFQNYENLTIGFIDSTDSHLIKIENNTECSIEMKGINGLSYINNEEDYNNKSNIKIYSSNLETALTCLIIE